MYVQQLHHTKYKHSAKSDSLNVDTPCLHSVCSSCLSPPLSLRAARRITMVVLSVRSRDVRERYVIVLEWGSLRGTNMCTHANVCLCVRVWQADRIRDEVIWRRETVHFCEPKTHWECQELAVQTPAAWWLHHICGETLSQRHEGNYLSLSTDILDGGVEESQAMSLWPRTAQCLSSIYCGGANRAALWLFLTWMEQNLVKPSVCSQNSCSEKGSVSLEDKIIKTYWALTHAPHTTHTRLCFSLFEDMHWVLFMFHSLLQPNPNLYHLTYFSFQSVSQSEHRHLRAQLLFTLHIRGIFETWEKLWTFFIAHWQEISWWYRCQFIKCIKVKFH